MPDGERKDLSPDLEVVKQGLRCGWSAVLAIGGRILDKEKGSGIKPAFLIVRRRFEGVGTFGSPEPHLVFGDKVLGLAAFRLGALLGAGVMWGNMISELAVKEAVRRGVRMCGSEFVPFILNRDGNDLCPMEKLASSCTDDAQFYAELEKLFIDT